MRSALLLCLFALAICATPARAEIHECDVLVFGGTAGGVAAACTAQRLGKKAILTEFGRHIGGLTSGGLGWTDIGNKAAIGGFSHEFYKRLGTHYGKPEAWTFEPRVAEEELRALLKESGVPVHFGQRLASVKKEGARIVEIAMENGEIFRAKMFIDATYEGDLMARAGVKYMVGREANSRFGETLNGTRAKTPSHQFLVKVDPFVKPGDPGSGLLPFVQPGDGGAPGEGGPQVQAYNFRLCFTKAAENKMPINPPAGYDAKRFELLGRYFEALAAAQKKVTIRNFLKIDMVTPEKTDINNNGGFSTDFIGENYAYPDADYATRERLGKAHEDYIRGFITFLANDARVPEDIRAEMQQWGLCKDEFQDTGGWPHQLYIREARRLLSDYVMTEKVCRQIERPEDSVGLGAYNMDSHNCQRLVKDGAAENEGDVQTGVKPYPVSYRSIVPKQSECENLFVPVCLSATHIAYGSIRMEPVFMIMGQSSATAASMAIDGGVAVQKIDYAKLREQLLKDGQVLEWKEPPLSAKIKAAAVLSKTGAGTLKLHGLILDDSDAQKTGDWIASTANAQLAGLGYVHDGDAHKGEMNVRWTPDVPEPGEYEMTLLFPPNSNRSNAVPVTIELPGTPAKTVKINEQETSGMGVLGKFHLPKGKGVTITLSNAGTSGHVVADGLLLRRVEK